MFINYSSNYTHKTLEQFFFNQQIYQENILYVF